MPDKSRELFESAVRSNSDRAGVFEYDGETGYFYLYAPQGPDGRKILASLHIVSGPFAAEGVQVRWDSTEGFVGLFIGPQLWAAFDSTTGAGYAGDYATGVLPEMPARIADAFSPP